MCRESEKQLKITSEGMGFLSEGENPWMNVCLNIIGQMDYLNEG